MRHKSSRKSKEKIIHNRFPYEKDPNFAHLQLARLNARLNGEVGAKKERARLYAILEKGGK